MQIFVVLRTLSPVTDIIRIIVHVPFLITAAIQEKQKLCYALLIQSMKYLLLDQLAKNHESSSCRSFDIGAQDWAQGEPPPLLPTSGVPTEAQRMGWTGKTRTRPWTGMLRACGAQILSRASRRPSLSTLPVAGGKSSCQMKGRCMVSTLRTSQTKQIESMCVSPK